MAYITVPAPAAETALPFDSTPKGNVPLNKIVTGGEGQANEVSPSNRLPVDLPDGYATTSRQDAIVAAIQALAGSEYEAVAASGSAMLGTTGAAGDLLVGMLVIPSSKAPGAISIKDGNGSALIVFAGGADSVAILHPFPVQLGIRSSSGGWSVTTGANVSLIAVGNFT